MNASDIKAGTKLFFRERALFPDLDEESYRRNKPLLVKLLHKINEGKDRPYKVSPSGRYLKLSKLDFEWVDPTDLRKRACFGIACSIDNQYDQKDQVKNERNGPPLDMAAPTQWITLLPTLLWRLDDNRLDRIKRGIPRRKRSPGGLDMGMLALSPLHRNP